MRRNMVYCWFFCVCHAVNEIDELWQQLSIVQEFSERDEIWQLDRGGLYITIQIGELWPNSPLGAK